MSNPLRQLRYLPWRSLAIIASITFAIVIAIELLLWMLFNQLAQGTQSNVTRTLVFARYLPFLIFLIGSASGLGVGALAVFLLETLDKQVFINAGVLWALILCLIIGLMIRVYIPIPNVNIPIILVGANIIQLTGIVVGVFWKGKRYWR